MFNIHLSFFLSFIPISWFFYFVKLMNFMAYFKVNVDVSNTVCIIFAMFIYIYIFSICMHLTKSSIFYVKPLKIFFWTTSSSFLSFLSSFILWNWSWHFLYSLSKLFSIKSSRRTKLLTFLRFLWRFWNLSCLWKAVFLHKQIITTCVYFLQKWCDVTLKWLLKYT